LKVIRANPHLQEDALQQIEKIEEIIARELPDAFLASASWGKRRFKGVQQDQAPDFIKNQYGQTLSDRAIARTVNQVMDASSIAEAEKSDYYAALLYMGALLDYARTRLENNNYRDTGGCLPSSPSDLAAMIGKIHEATVRYEQQKQSACC